MTAREALERYLFGVAKGPASIPDLVEIFTGRVLQRWPDYWEPVKYTESLVKQSVEDGAIPSSDS